MIEIDTEKMELILTPQFANKYGKWVYKDSGKFVCWAKFPKTSEKQVQRQAEILDFVCNCGFRNITRKQLHRLLKLYHKTHLGVDEMFYSEIMTRFKNNPGYEPKDIELMLQAIEDDMTSIDESTISNTINESYQET